MTTEGYTCIKGIIEEHIAHQYLVLKALPKIERLFKYKHYFLIFSIHVYMPLLTTPEGVHQSNTVKIRLPMCCIYNHDAMRSFLLSKTEYQSSTANSNRQLKNIA